MDQRERIIFEIRRLAEFHGGIAPGKVAFERETGIKEADWSGRYWSRWSDAVREAGFEPNTMTTAYPRQQLLESLAAIVSDLGHWPTSAELRLELRRRDGVPSHNTFYRLGNREAQLRAVVEQADELSIPPDIQVTLRHQLSQLPRRRERDPGTGAPKQGFVYLLKSGRHYKIGYSNSPGRRAYEVDLRMPDEVTLVHEIATDDPPGVEAYWHGRFADRRRRGEWFDLEPEDVRAFKARKSM